MRSITTRTVGVSLLLATVALTTVKTSTAHADPESPWTAGVQFGSRWRTDRAWGVFSDSPVVPVAGFYVGRDVTPSLRLFVVSVELGWTFENGSRQLRQSYDSALATNAFTAAAAVRWRIPGARWLQPFVRVNGGALYSAGHLDPNGNGSDLSISQWTWQVGAGLGLSVTTGPFLQGIGWRTARFTAGVETGYRWTGAPTLTATNNRSDGDPTAIATSAVDLGAVSLAGHYLRVNIGLRF